MSIKLILLKLIPLGIEVRFLQIILKLGLCKIFNFRDFLTIAPFDPSEDILSKNL